jgi:hypothetical protein
VPAKQDDLTKAAIMSYPAHPFFVETIAAQRHAELIAAAARYRRARLARQPRRTATDTTIRNPIRRRLRTVLNGRLAAS